MKFKIVLLLVLNVFFVVATAQIQLNPFSAKRIDYQKTFSEKIKRQARNVADFKYSNLEPMLDVGVMVPNSGIFRLWYNQTWNSGNISKYTNIFKESPYKSFPPLLYSRLDWCFLEDNKNEFNFNVFENLFKQCIERHSRCIIGLACNCGSMSSGKLLSDGYKCSVPEYILNELTNTPYPMYKDDLYGKAYIANYDSPLLLERYQNLLKNFANWIEGFVDGTSIRRKNLIYGIEMRYLGYWGEGSTRYFPKTNLIDKYIDSYVEYFPDIQLIAPGQSTLHLPSNTNYLLNKNEYKSAMIHVGKLLRTRNKFGYFGLFIDGWSNYNNQYDVVSDKVLFDEKGHLQSLAVYLKNNFYGKRYITGELDLITNTKDKKFVPYNGLYQQFVTRGVGGLSVSSLRCILNGTNIQLTDSQYENTKNCLSILGYRIVLGCPKIIKTSCITKVLFYLTNVGVSNIYHNYYKIHLLVKDDSGKLIEDKLLNFDLRNLKVTNSEPLLYRAGNGTLIQGHIKSKHGNVYLRIEDEKCIEYPMTLSNFGRNDDGSYLLGKIK